MSIEAMKQALEALCDFDYDKRQSAINALRVAIEQAQEPQCAHGIDQKECGWCGPAKRNQTRPRESDYQSHVAYTRALEAYCDTLEKHT